MKAEQGYVWIFLRGIQAAPPCKIKGVVSKKHFKLIFYERIQVICRKLKQKTYM